MYRSVHSQAPPFSESLSMSSTGTQPRHIDHFIADTGGPQPSPILLQTAHTRAINTPASSPSRQRNAVVFHSTALSSLIVIFQRGGK